MTYVREHDLAKEHPICIAGIKNAENAIKRAKKADIKRAQKLRAKAKAMLNEASELEYQANKYSEHNTKYAKQREEIEDAAYWKAREIIGKLPRNENGDYIDPAPFWIVTMRKTGELIGEFQGEEYSDVLRVICPHDDPRSWSDFECVRKPA